MNVFICDLKIMTQWPNTEIRAPMLCKTDKQFYCAVINTLKRVSDPVA